MPEDSNILAQSELYVVCSSQLFFASNANMPIIMTIIRRDVLKSGHARTHVVINEMTMVENTSKKSLQRQHREFAEDTDEELLLYMADQKKNPDEARVAWEEFYSRHAKYVLEICRRACNAMLDDDMVNSIMVDTFIKAYLSADTYKLGCQQQVDKIRWRVRSWLGVIAKHATFDVLRGQRDSGAIQIEPEEWGRIDSDQKYPISKDTEIVRKMMEQVLDDREKAVLRTTYMYYNPDKEYQRLPNDVVDQLCKCFRTTPVNLRRIRKKATEKIKEALIAMGYKNHKSS